MRAIARLFIFQALAFASQDFYFRPQKTIKLPNLLGGYYALNYFITP